MDANIKRLLGEGPYPSSFKTNSENNNVDIAIGPGMIILASKDSVHMPKGRHGHASYEFTIPFSHMPDSVIGRNLVIFEEGKLYPINPEQEHGPLEEMQGCRLLGLHIGRETFNEITQSMCNKRDIDFNNECIRMDSSISDLINMFIMETKNLQMASKFVLQNITSLMVINFLRKFKSNLPQIIKESNYCERDNINKAIEFLREEYNNDFSIEDVAHTANLSTYHFIRIFKSMTGITPYDYLLNVKIEKAIELLKLKKHTITEICFMCGFNNPGHFSSVFKRKIGIVPSQYRKMYT
jgi:AraC-like DNA-binding protein